MCVYLFTHTQSIHTCIYTYYTHIYSYTYAHTYIHTEHIYTHTPIHPPSLHCTHHQPREQFEWFPMEQKSFRLLWPEKEIMILIKSQFCEFWCFGLSYYECIADSRLRRELLRLIGVVFNLINAESAWPANGAQLHVFLKHSHIADHGIRSHGPYKVVTSARVK